MSERLSEIADLPKQFVKEGTQVHFFSLLPLKPTLGHILTTNGLSTGVLSHQQKVSNLFLKKRLGGINDEDLGRRTRMEETVNKMCISLRNTILFHQNAVLFSLTLSRSDALDTPIPANENDYRRIQTALSSDSGWIRCHGIHWIYCEARSYSHVGLLSSVIVESGN
nr:hypothetical protein L203_05413 [Cryptococcus depauperatus CBS 7841]